jgi:carbonic anhydrase
MKLNRRAFSATAVGSLLSGAGVSEGAQQEPQPEPVPKNCEEALARLMAGNRRFVSGESKHPHFGKDWRKRLAGGQKPFATILGCSDSRVPPELLFDQGFGDLFVIRIAGNIIDTDVTGSIEYGVDHLRTRLVVVMGHDGCGAVTAALQADEDLKAEPNEIRSLVDKIKPATKSVSTSLEFPVRLKQSVEANVRASVKLLKAVPDLAKAEKAKAAKIIGCVYDIESGRVRTL